MLSFETPEPENDVIEADKQKTVMLGKRLRFFPTTLGDARMAVMLEIL